MANYDVNYNDRRFQNVETEKNNALNEANSTYDNMIKNSDNKYNELIQASKDYANVQGQNQQARTDFAIEQINQQKDQTQKDYTREQMGAYTDWQKQSNRYGANAEMLASQGLSNSGYSESSQVSMYNTYQNRVAKAKESFNQAVLNYNNAIKDAQLSNNEAQAQIAYNALQQQLELALQGFEYKNTLLQSQLATKMDINNQYYNRYQDVLSQINTENQFRYQQERDRIKDAQWQKEYNLSVSKANSAKNSSSSLEVDTGNNNDNVEMSSKAKELDKTLSKTIEKANKNLNADNIFTRNGVNSDLTSNLTSKGYETVLSGVRNSIYNANKKGEITDKEAETLYNKYGL